MKKIKCFYSKIQYEFLILPKIWQFVVVVLLILFIYQIISLYLIEIELDKNRIEYEKLKQIN